MSGMMEMSVGCVTTPSSSSGELAPNPLTSSLNQKLNVIAVSIHLSDAGEAVGMAVIGRTSEEQETNPQSNVLVCESQVETRTPLGNRLLHHEKETRCCMSLIKTFWHVTCGFCWRLWLEITNKGL